MSAPPLHYFVDEAGDSTLFGRFGKEILGEAGVSRFFIVGRLEVDDADALASDLENLRAELLADPLLNSVPSMQAAQQKTARFFHAKDDVPEVRLHVFRVLRRHGMAPHKGTTVRSAYPWEHAGLQACDHFLWALQRFYERGEERFLSAMWQQFVEVIDLDLPAPKQRGKPRGNTVIFNEEHPLTLESRAGVGMRDREI